MVETREGEATTPGSPIWELGCSVNTTAFVASIVLSRCRVSMGSFALVRFLR
jgi:hypothetical protein